MMILMSFKKQERAKPYDAISLALHYFMKKIELMIDESWVKTLWSLNQINQQVHVQRDPHLIHTWGVHFSPHFFLPLMCFLCQASWNGICLPSQTGGQLLQRGLCLAAGLLRYATLWQHGARPHIWPCGLTIWRPTVAGPGGDSSSHLGESSLADRGERKDMCSCHFCVVEEISKIAVVCETMKWLFQQLENGLSSLFFRIDKVLGKEFLRLYTLI